MGRLAWIASEVGSATGFPKGMMIQQKPQLEGGIFSCVTPPVWVPPIQTEALPLLIDAGQAVNGHGNRLCGAVANTCRASARLHWRLRHAGFCSRCVRVALPPRSQDPQLPHLGKQRGALHAQLDGCAARSTDHPAHCLQCL